MNVRRLAGFAVIAYACAAFLLLANRVPDPPAYPTIALASEDGGKSFEVVAVEDGLQWEDFTPFGCNRRPSGPVEVGDSVSGCAGKVALIYKGR